MVYNRIVTAADTKYFQEFGISFIASCVENETPAHCTIIDPTDDDIQLAKKLLEYAKSRKFEQYIEFDFRSIPVNVPLFDNFAWTQEQRKMFYCVSKFIAFISLEHRYKNQLSTDNKTFSCFMTDIDIILREKLEFPDSPLGFLMREYEPHVGMKILSSGFVRTDAIDFVSKFINEMFSVPELFTWFRDQQLLYNIIKEDCWKSKNYDLARKNIISWDFNEDAVIWYPKGPRKSHPKYAAEKQRLEKLFGKRL